MKTGIALFVLVMLCSQAVMARTYTERNLTWVCPTTREGNGGAFDCATEAAGYDLEVTQPGKAAFTVEYAPNITKRVITTEPADTIYKIRICDKAGLCSAWSGTVNSPTAPAKMTIKLN